MVHFEYWYEAFIFIGIFAFLMIVPCVGVAVIGYRMIEKLGHFPSKTPFIQMSIFFALVSIEVFSFGLILLFFKFFSAANK